jgi:phosphohistidine phosphatase
MKKLLLIRHAKATHETGFKDFERPLQESGLKHAAIMASHLKEKGYVPEILIASPALRTLSTANIFSQHLGIPHAQTNEVIYEAGVYNLIKVINDVPVEHNFIALVGHNPGISELLYYLTGQVQDVPTCAMMLIEFDKDDWKSITSDEGELIYYDYPKKG